MLADVRYGDEPVVRACHDQGLVENARDEVVADLADHRGRTDGDCRSALTALRARARRSGTLNPFPGSVDASSQVEHGQPGATGDGVLLEHVLRRRKKVLPE